MIAGESAVAGIADAGKPRLGNAALGYNAIPLPAGMKATQR
jgi:hypothetical protein